MTRAAKFTLLYRGVDISSELDPMTTSVSYEDKLHGEADEIGVSLQDSDGRWRGPWFPDTGDTMRLWYGWDDGRQMYAGEFELDEPEATIGRGGDTFTIRGIAAPITKALRTEKTAKFEDMSVEEIVRKLAAENGLSVRGTFNDTRYRLKNQRRMRDLEFLVQLGEDTDHYVSVRGAEIQFTAVDAIDGQAPAAVFTPGHRDHAGFVGRFQSADTYSKAETRHLHELKKELVEGEEADGRIRTGDVLKLVERVEDKAQANLMAKGRLHQKNRKRRSGTLTLVGRPDLVAGSVIELAGHGAWDGRYVVDASRHTLTRGPYPTVLRLTDARA